MSATVVPPEAVDVSTCSAEALSSWLLEHRFANDEKGAAAFLLQAVASIPNAHALSEQLVQEQRDEQQVQLDVDEQQQHTSEIQAKKESLLETQSIELSFLAPRSKFQTSFFNAEGIRVIDKNGAGFSVVPSLVENIIVFPKPEDCPKIMKQQSKAIIQEMVLVTFIQDDGSHSFPKYKNKPLHQVCFQLPNSKPVCTDQNAVEQEGFSDHTGQWCRILCASFDINPSRIARVLRMANSAATGKAAMFSFQSHQEEATSTTTGGMPFVKCYSGVHDGALFPIEEGLLFFKPPMFVSRRKMHSISCGRGANGGTGSRYVDLVVVDHDENTVEFTNIHRSEMSVLQDYISHTLIPALQGENGNDAREIVGGNETDDAESDDDDEESSSSTKGSSEYRPKRKASKDARSATRQQIRQTNSDEDEDGDDDFYEGNDTASGEESSADETSDVDDYTESENDDDGEYKSYKQRRLR